MSEVYLPILGAIVPLFLLDKIALYLMAYVVPLGVHSIKDVGIVFAFVVFTIAIAYLYIMFVAFYQNKIEKGRVSNASS